MAGNPTSTGSSGNNPNVDPAQMEMILDLANKLGEQMTGSWACVYCTHLNAPFLKICSICFSEPPPEYWPETRGGEENFPATDEDLEHESLHWTCPECTLKNSLRSPGCSVCNAKRPNIEMLPESEENELRLSLRRQKAEVEARGGGQTNRSNFCNNRESLYIHESKNSNELEDGDSLCGAERSDVTAASGAGVQMPPVGDSDESVAIDRSQVVNIRHLSEILDHAKVLGEVPDEGSWECLHCTRLNPPMMKQCCSCLAEPPPDFWPAQAKESVPEPVDHDLNQAATEEDLLDDSLHWTCPKCTLKNSLRSPGCFTCQAQRPPDMVLLPEDEEQELRRLLRLQTKEREEEGRRENPEFEDSDDSEPPISSDEDDDGYCAGGFVRLPVQRSVRHARPARGSAAPRVGGARPTVARTGIDKVSKPWKCQDCTYMNSAVAASCDLCGSKPPEDRS